MKEKENISDINKELQGLSKLQSLKGKNSFQVPKGYFDNLEDDIMSKIAKETTLARKIHMNTKQVLLYAAAASIVALFIFIALRSNKPNTNQNPIADQPTELQHDQSPIADSDKPSVHSNKNASSPHEAESVEKVKPLENSTIALEEKKTPINKVNNPNQEVPQNNSTKNRFKDEEDHSNLDMANNDNDLNNSGSSFNMGNQAISAGSTPVNTTNYSLVVARKAVQKDLYLGEDRCSNKVVHLNAQIKNLSNLKYLWSTDDTTPAITVHKSGSYWVKVYDIKNNLLGSDTVKVKIVSVPKPNLGEDRSICNYESILISSGCKSTVFNYQWNINDATTQEIYLSDLEPGIYSVELKVTSCADTVASTMILTVKDCNLKIPNVITPNGDGRNDRFVIKGLEYYPGSQLHILDRNGHIVYESMDYQNDWDANGISAGTYFFRLQLNDEKKSEKNGTLSIIR